MMQISRLPFVNQSRSTLLLSNVSPRRRFSSTQLSGEIQRVGVVGLGLMGHGIAQTSAQSGFQVVGVESSQDRVDKGKEMITSSLNTQFKKAVKEGKAEEGDSSKMIDGVLTNLNMTTDKEALGDCDLIVEAIVEDLNAKKELFSTLNSVARENAILATNTSSFELSNLHEACGRPGNLVGLHFFNPVQIMKLVEVVRTEKTDPKVFEQAMEFGRSLGKSPVACKDTPGFIVNRLLVPYMAEAAAMVERGDATPQDVDTAMKLGAGYPMGPLTLADYVGLDTCVSILKGWVAKYPDTKSFFVPQILEQMVAEGKLGRKSGQGFYKWEGNKPVA